MTRKIGRWAREDGNFLVISVACLVLLGFLFVIIQDVLRKNAYEDELQKLADNTALHTAALVPSVSVSSYIKYDTQVTDWMARQGYGVGAHVLSAVDATEVDRLALLRAEEYLNRAALSSGGTNYFGGNLVTTTVSPKFVAHKEGDKQIVDYYVLVELKTKWGGAWLGRSEDITATAIARATIDYEAFYSRSEIDPDSWTVDDVFANGIYGRGVVDLQNWGGNEEVTIVGDIHSEEAILTISYEPTDSVSIYGSISAPDLQVNAGAVDNLTGAQLEGAASPSMVAPAMPPPVIPAAQLAAMVEDVPFIMSPPDTNYVQPVIVWPGNFGADGGATGNFPPVANPVFIDPATGQPYTQGTFFVANLGPDQGDLHLSGTGLDGGDPNISGNWCFVTAGDVHLNNLKGGITGGDMTNEVFFNVGGDIHINNITGPVTLNGSFMADNITINNTDCDYPFTVLGGLYAVGDPPASGKVNLTAMKSGFTLIHKEVPSIMPPDLKYPVVIYSTPPNYSSPRVVLIN